MSGRRKRIIRNAQEMDGRGNGCSRNGRDRRIWRGPHRAGFLRADGPRREPHGCEGRIVRTKNLRGPYGFTTTGSIVSGGPPGLVADVGVLTFDGQGGVSQVETLSLNGLIIPERLSISGIYSVDDNCTGDMTIVVPAP